MGWLEELLVSKSKSWIYYCLNEKQTPGNFVIKAVEAKKEYLHIRLNSMHIVNVRKGLTKFYATVNSFISIPHKSGKAATFNVVATPNKLKELDAGNIENVVSVNIPLLGPVPYQGGVLAMELGLFSIKSSDLTKPYLTLLSQLSSTAGVSFISSALPFANLIKNGISMLVGGDQLEIGLSTSLDSIQTGYYVLIHATKDELDVNKIELGSDFLLYYQDKKPINDYSYMVFQIYTKNNRDDWFNIPEVLEAYKKIQSAERLGKATEITSALIAFKLAVYTSPDLITQDAEKIFLEVDTEVKRISGGTTSKSALLAQPLKDLKDYNIF